MLTIEDRIFTFLIRVSPRLWCPFTLCLFNCLRTISSNSMVRTISSQGEHLEWELWMYKIAWNPVRCALCFSHSLRDYCVLNSWCPCFILGCCLRVPVVPSFWILSSSPCPLFRVVGCPSSLDYFCCCQCQYLSLRLFLKFYSPLPDFFGNFPPYTSAHVYAELCSFCPFLSWIIFIDA